MQQQAPLHSRNQPCEWLRWQVRSSFKPTPQAPGTSRPRPTTRFPSLVGRNQGRAGGTGRVGTQGPAHGQPRRATQWQAAASPRLHFARRCQLLLPSATIPSPTLPLAARSHPTLLTRLALHQENLVVSRAETAQDCRRQHWESRELAPCLPRHDLGVEWSRERRAEDRGAERRGVVACVVASLVESRWAWLPRGGGSGEGKAGIGTADVLGVGNVEEAGEVVSTGFLRQREVIGMELGCDSIALDMDIAPWGGQEYVVPTSFGHISVTVCGDQDKPALVTYPDVGLNYLSCFEGLFSCPEASSVLFHNFCIFHINPPGHELGAPENTPEQSSLSADDLADQVAEVLDYFGLEEVIGLGVTGGAYVLSLFACKYADRAMGLILVSPVARTPSWTEWLQNQAMISLLYFCGMTGFVKERLCQRYFSPEVLNSPASEGRTDALTTIRRYMDDRRSKNVLRYLQAIHHRRDLTENLKKMKCRTLILVGDQSPFHREAVHISDTMNRRYNALIEVEGCGSLVTEERPQSMLVPIELFLTGYAFYQRPLLSLASSPRSPLSPPCMPAELLSLESLGLKLKPIKTRVSSLG